MTVILLLVFTTIWWKVSAHKYFTGQVRNIDIEEAIGPEPPVGPAAPKPTSGA